jgi:hypothetical protein
MPPPDQHRDRHRTSTAVGTSSIRDVQDENIKLIFEELLEAIEDLEREVQRRPR